MLLTTPEYVKSMGLFVRVWRNEFTRVICDRLISVEVGAVINIWWPVARMKGEGR
jgi:hypothetical protein